MRAKVVRRGRPKFDHSHGIGRAKITDFDYSVTCRFTRKSCRYGGFYWLIDTTQRFAGFPWIAGFLVLLLFCAARALIFLLFTAVVCAIRRRVAVPMTLIAPVGMAACEFLVPQIFPCGQWITQAWHPLVIQIAEITGPWGITALLMMVNGAIYWEIR